MRTAPRLLHSSIPPSGIVGRKKRCGERSGGRLDLATAVRARPDASATPTRPRLRLDPACRRLHRSRSGRHPDVHRVDRDLSPARRRACELFPSGRSMHADRVQRATGRGACRGRISGTDSVRRPRCSEPASCRCACHSPVHTRGHTANGTRYRTRSRTAFSRPEVARRGGAAIAIALLSPSRTRGTARGSAPLTPAGDDAPSSRRHTAADSYARALSSRGERHPHDVSPAP
jgi:hypothetical protein